MSTDSVDEFNISTEHAIDQLLSNAESFASIVSYWLASLNVSPIFLQTSIKPAIIIIFDYLNTNWNIVNHIEHISYFEHTLKQFYINIARPIPQKRMDQSLLNSIETSVHQVINWFGYHNMFSYKLVAYGSMLHNIAITSSDYDIGIVIQSFDIDNINSKWIKRDILNKIKEYINIYLYAVFSCKIKGSKYPTLEIKHHSLPFSADISVDNGSICTRNKVINEWLSELDKQHSVRETITFIKTWSKTRNINSNWQKYLSSYAYLLMGILIHKLYEKCTDLEILIAFFWYFGYMFDPEQDIIVVDKYPKAYVNRKITPNGNVTILDPVTNNNVSIACDWTKWLEIKTEMRIAYTICVWWTDQCSNNNLSSLINVLTHQVELRVCEWINNDEIANMLHNKRYRFASFDINHVHMHKRFLGYNTTIGEGEGECEVEVEGERPVNNNEKKSEFSCTLPNVNHSNLKISTQNTKSLLNTKKRKMTIINNPFLSLIAFLPAFFYVVILFVFCMMGM